MDSNLIAAAISGAGAVGTVLVSAFTLVRSGKDKKDRQADRTVAERTAEKLEAEHDQIVEQTRGMLLQDVREELRRAKEEAESYRKEAEDCRKEAEKYRNEVRALRDALIEKNDRIDAQTRVIRRLTSKAERLTRRAEALERWIEDNAQRFHELGIDGLPMDILEDRRSEEEDEGDNVEPVPRHGSPPE